MHINQAGGLPGKRGFRLPPLLVLFILAGSMPAQSPDVEPLPGGSCKLPWAVPSFYQEVSGCLAGLEKARTGDAADGSGSIQISGAGNSIVVRHQRAIFNCCAEPFLELAAFGNHLIFIEWENETAPCDCLCPYDLQGTAAGLPDGTYRILVIRGMDGTLLAAAKITLPGSHTWYQASLCLDQSGTGTEEHETIEARLHPGGFAIHHRGVSYNCCATMKVLAESGARQFDFYETERYPGPAAPCKCLCPYDLAMGADGLEPGRVRVRVFDACGQRICFDQELIIPPPGFTNHSSGCLQQKSAVEGTLTVTVEERTIRVRHTAAIWNCCSKPALHLLQDGFQLTFIELEHLDAMPCHCVCPFDLEACQEKLAAGEYTVRVLNGETGEVLLEKIVVVGGR